MPFSRDRYTQLRQQKHRQRRNGKCCLFFRDVPKPTAAGQQRHTSGCGPSNSDSHANLYVRWSAAGRYKYLVRDQKVSVDDAVARLDRLFHETKNTGDDGCPGSEHCYELSAGLMDVIYSIGGSSRSTVFPDDQNWDFVEEWIISRKELNEPSGSADACETTDVLRRLPPTRIEDCLEELRRWAAFEPTAKPLQRPEPRPSERPKPAVSRPSNQPLPPSVEKPVGRAARVPRNAPCPRGSGKKYKQCCLRKET